MKLQPIVYVTDMDRAVAWYSVLLTSEPEVSSTHWTTFAMAGGHLALHLGDEPASVGSVELSLVTDEPLEVVVERVEPLRGISDEAFGRSIIVNDPDGTKIQVNEHDPSLY